MAKYRKKPLIIEAVQWKGIIEDMMAFGVHKSDFDYLNRLHIQTLEGRMRADIGDYIIKGITGEFYPCKPHIFEASYEAVD